MLAQFTLTLLFFISCWGISMGLIVLFCKTVNPFLNRLLGFTIMVMTWPYVQTTLIATGTILKIPCIYGAFAFFYFLTPPLTFIYLRALLYDETRFYRTDLLHMIPPFIQLVLSLPYLFGGYAYQFPFAQELVAGKNVTQLTPITVVPQKIALVLLFIETAIYIYYSLKLIATRKKQLAPDQAHQFIIHQWAKSFMYYCIAIVGFIFLNTFRQYLGIEFFDFIPFGGPLFYLRCILFSMILIGLFKNPEVLFGLPNFNKNIMEEREGQKIIKHQAAFNPEKYYSPISTLTKSQVDQYATILSNYMEGPEKPFTKHNFNIKDLSNGSGIPQHHLAYFFRYHFTEGFVDYRNRHRFNEVLNKIHQGEFKKKTLEGIASESGFASRITFFNVFKKHTGMSASDYIEKMKQR